VGDDRVVSPDNHGCSFTLLLAITLWLSGILNAKWTDCDYISNEEGIRFAFYEWSTI
jgi:hypothetical protein